VYFMDIWSILQLLDIFYGHLVYLVLIRYIFPSLVYCTKKNLATLPASMIITINCIMTLVGRNTEMQAMVSRRNRSLNKRPVVCVAHCLTNSAFKMCMHVIVTER
jgi:hypothetical protein